MATIHERERGVGLASGSLWLMAVSAAFATWALLSIGTSSSRAVLAATAVLVCGLAALGMVVIRAALGLPENPLPRTRDEQRMGRRFAWVIALEVAAFVVVNTVAGIRGEYALMPSLNLMVVGVHFLPLAWIFRVPRYYVMGLLFCVIPVLTLLLIPAQSVVGHALAWYVVPSLGCGFVASLIAIAGLREAWQSVSALRTAAA